MTASSQRLRLRTWDLDTPTSPGWQQHANCRHTDPTWYDLIGEKLTPENQAAIRTCTTCPVQTQCDADAAATRADGVIRAGAPWTGGRPRHTRGPRPLPSQRTDPAAP